MLRDLSKKVTSRLYYKRVSSQFGLQSYINDWVGPYNNQAFTDGTSVPNYQRLIRKGLNASSSYTRYASTMTIARDDMSYAFVNGNDTLTTNWTLGYVSPSVFNPVSEVSKHSLSPDVYNELKSAYISRCRGILSEMDGPAFLGELVSTIHGLTHPIQGIREALSLHMNKAYRGLPKYVNAHNKRRFLKAVSQSWLETQFAIAPLMSDIQGICTVISEEGLRPKQLSVSSIFRGSVSLPTVKSTSNVDSRAVITTDSTSKVKYEAKIKGKINCSFPGRDLLQTRLGVIPGYFAPTVYEIIPLSWLVDYFSNLGDFIKVASFPLTQLVYSNYILKTVVDTDIETSLVPNGSLVSVAGSSSVHHHSEKYVRIPANLNPPYLSLKIPGLGDWKQILNVAAYVNQNTTITNKLFRGF